MVATPTTTNPTAPAVNQTTIAADELIAVTGEKSIDRQWDLADALLKASPVIDSRVLAAIRQAAIDKAGHDEFWQVPRLRQLANTADAWPKKDRVAGVALDSHLEASRRTATIADAKAAIVKAGQTSKVPGKPSIREIRAQVGANGTTAAPPRVDKADAEELFKRLIPRQKELESFLRKNLRVHEQAILAFAKIFAEAEQKVMALAPKTQAPAVPVVAGEKKERQARVKGL